ncbi:ABC transporter [Methanocaldococcus villosus KIN24-T80]|uniref:ABC transporter n=1 Tax=Methanocaldococcus villosus KIN24-T80 TaxID=1069083 RepID=N6VY83_9EURY|nr:ABC transporter ATP-binding protein [Methanocaldococcus villosus]ENN96062.1 ABC transporter [Methanocaldococcus villosus KIN24-T80]
MILSVDNIKFSYKSREVLKGVTFKVKRGEVASILGENGSGKSTLLKCINKILKPKIGSIFIEKYNINELNSKELSKKIAYVPQKSNANYITVFDAVLLGRKPYIKFDVSDEDIKVVEEVLKLMELEDIAFRYINELSGGELQRVVIARALAQEPRVLLLDEPTNNLDLRYQLKILKLIREITKIKNIATIMVMHDINLALRFSDKFLFMKDGIIYYEGEKNSITPEIIEEVYGIKVYIGYYNNTPVVIPI